MRLELARKSLHIVWRQLWYGAPRADSINIAVLTKLEQEEMQRLKESQGKAQAVYEKEVRRARKEAFKSSSEVVKLREELKSTRDRFKMSREDIEIQKRKVENREKEAFSAKYQLVGVEEELERMKQQLKLVEEERDSLRMSLKEEEVARIAAEGRIPLPPSQSPDEFSSPRKPKRDLISTPIDGEIPATGGADDNAHDTELEDVRFQLAFSRQKRKELEETVELMNVECQLKICSCRLAERGGEEYVYDRTYKKTVAEAKTKPQPANEKKPRTPAIVRGVPKPKEDDSEKTPQPWSKSISGEYHMNPRRIITLNFHVSSENIRLTTGCQQV